MYREYDVFPLISHHVVQFFSSFDSFDSYQKKSWFLTTVQSIMSQLNWILVSFESHFSFIVTFSYTGKSHQAWWKSNERGTN